MAERAREVLRTMGYACHRVAATRRGHKWSRVNPHIQLAVVCSKHLSPLEWARSFAGAQLLCTS